jgi:hypothetical protein
MNLGTMTSNITLRVLYAERRVFEIVMLSVIILSVVILNVIMLSAIILNVIMLNIMATLPPLSA